MIEARRSPEEEVGRVHDFGRAELARRETNRIECENMKRLLVACTAIAEQHPPTFKPK